MGPENVLFCRLVRALFSPDIFFFLQAVAVKGLMEGSIFFFSFWFSQRNARSLPPVIPIFWLGLGTCPRDDRVRVGGGGGDGGEGVGSGQWWVGGGVWDGVVGGVKGLGREGRCTCGS